MRHTVEADANVTIEVRDAVTKQLVHREQVHNLVTLAGRNLIRDFLNGVPSAKRISHFAVGAGGAAPQASDTALGAQIHRGVISMRTPGSGKLTLHYFMGGGEANGSTLTEAGLFNDEIAGAMFARVVFTPIFKSASLTVTFAWEITLASV